MTRRLRIAAFSAGGVVLALLLASAVGIVIFRSAWFGEKVRARIVAEAEKAVNGKVEIGAFRFDWHTLTAELDNVIVHGTEPAGQAPLLAIRRLVVGLKIISLTERSFNIARLEADSPRAHLIVQANGDNNIPPPHTITPQKILDLRVGKFDTADGSLLLEISDEPPRQIPLRAHGEDVSADAVYESTKARYDGKVSFGRLNLNVEGYGPIDAQITANLSMERNRFTIPFARAKTANSMLEIRNAMVDNFAAPVVTAKYTAQLNLGEVDRIFRLVNFAHSGTVGAEGEARFASVNDYRVSGTIQGAGLAYGKVRNLSVAGNFEAGPDRVALSRIRVAAPGGSAFANGEIRDLSTFHLTGTVDHFDAAALMSLADLQPLPYDGLLSGPFDAAGRISERDFHDLVVSAKVMVSPAPHTTPVSGELDARYDGAAGAISFGNSRLELPHSSVTFSGIPSRQLDVKLQSGDLNELKAAITIPNSLRVGPELFSASFEGSVAGQLTDPRIAGHAEVRNAIYENQKVDSAGGDFTASNSGVTVANLALAASGLSARINGSFGLARWQLTDASAIKGSVQIVNGDLAKALALAHLGDLRLTGTVTTTAQLSGTVGDPHVNASLTVTKGEIYGEPYDSLTGNAQYLNGGAQTLNAVIAAGTKRANLTGRLESGPLQSSKVTFNVSTNALPLNQLMLVRRKEPDIRGTAQVKADGSVEISQDRKHVKVLELNADVVASALGLGTRNFGDARFSAETKNGILSARVNSNAASATIQGDGSISLAGDYPINARVSFSNVRLNAVEAILYPTAPERTENFDGSIAGQVVLIGPAGTPDLITASLNVSQFELRPLPRPGQAAGVQNLVLRNNGPLRMTLARSVISVEQARFQAPDTDLEMLGRISLRQTPPLDLRVQGTVGLALAQTFSQDLTSSGQLAVNANIRGSLSNPLFDGRAELQKAEFHYAGFVNGLTNVNAAVSFNGTRATIQNFSGESGGGKVDASGFAAFANGLLSFRVETKARAVRVRYPEGVSSLSDADLTLAGTSERSEVSGSVTLRRIAINPKSDAVNILASSAEPLRTPAASTGLAANMNLDIQIETAPDIAFETSVAQSVQADASLRLRGTVTNPALLGRVTISEGELVFFGNKYTINQGTVSFFNPAKIEPILNISLETKARGVDVILAITGPITKLNVSYRSDPPLQFGDIVALLATGRAPGSGGLVATNNANSEAFQQLGASALIDQALANPGSGNGRLQRFFGVSKIKIDPQLTGITGSPEARLTIEQQVTPQILFTYVSDVSSTSTQLIRVEWDFNPRWGAILTREENGYVELGFAWKKRFK